MNCPTAETWVLAARTAADLPKEVRDHVAVCPVCAALLARVVRLDAAVRRLPGPVRPASRPRLAAAVARTPQVAPARAAGDGSRRRVAVPRWAAAVAAGLLLAAGWLAGRFIPSTPTPMPADAKAAAPPRAVPLMVRVSGTGARAVEAPSARGQLDALVRLAAEIRGEAIRQAEAGTPDPIPHLAVVHDRVLRLGVARQLTRFPEPGEAAVRREVVADLRRAAGETAGAADHCSPAVGDLLRPLAASAGAVADAAEAGKAPAAPAAEWPVPAAPLDSTAALLVRLADAGGPLARADISAELGGVFAQTVALLSASGDPDAAGQVGEALNAVMARGVADNLDRVEAADPGGQLAPEVARVRDRAGRATDVLERNLAKAPPAARPGLERAVEASGPGRAATKGGKPPHAGPPWKRVGDPPGKGVPPGWQKKP